MQTHSPSLLNLMIKTILTLVLLLNSQGIWEFMAIKLLLHIELILSILAKLLLTILHANLQSQTIHSMCIAMIKILMCASYPQTILKLNAEHSTIV
jgi:hypothetical protein